MERKLPDTPWHIGYTKKAENDPRRHKARCIHYKNGKCNSSQSNYYQENCGGSSHCEEYAESDEDYQQNLQNRKTVTEIENEKIEKYKSSLTRKKAELTKSKNSICHMSTANLRRCLVCDEPLKKEQFSLKRCVYCGMYYVNIQDYSERKVLEIVKTDDVFFMNIPTKKNEIPRKTIVVNDAYCKYKIKKQNDKNNCEKHRQA